MSKSLSQQAAPAPVLAWIRRPLSWLEVRPDPPYDPTLDFLDPGERAALGLAGALGVLADAYVAGLIDFDRALARLGSAAGIAAEKGLP